MKEQAPNSPPGRVFILSIKDADIVFLPDSNEIVSVLKLSQVEAAAVWETETPPRGEASRRT